MNLANQQHIYLQTIFDHFHEKAEWPTYSYVDKKLFREHGLNAKEISTSLPNGFANGFRFDSDLGNQAMLSLEAIRTCDNSAGDLANFITFVRFLVDRYKKAEEDHPLVTHADLKNQLHMTDDAIARVVKMISGEHMLCSMSSGDGYGTWQCRLDREIRRFNEVTSIDDYLERRNKERITARQQATGQLKLFLGYMYRKSGSGDAQAGLAAWIKNLTDPDNKTGTKEKTGAKLEVALLNALTRLGVPTLFGGDVELVLPNTGETVHSGPETPIFDLVALNFGSPPMQSPTAVLISCKSTTNQPNRTDIALLSNEAHRVHELLPDWLVFGALVNLGEPTADEFNSRQDVRIWKQSHLQALLHAKEYRHVAQFLWTPPWHWKRDIEIMWWNAYIAQHRDIFSGEQT